MVGRAVSSVSRVVVAAGVARMFNGGFQVRWLQVLRLQLSELRLRVARTVPLERPEIHRASGPFVWPMVGEEAESLESSQEGTVERWIHPRHKLLAPPHPPQVEMERSMEVALAATERREEPLRGEAVGALVQQDQDL